MTDGYPVGPSLAVSGIQAFQMVSLPVGVLYKASSSTESHGGWYDEGAGQLRPRFASLVATAKCFGNANLGGGSCRRRNSLFPSWGTHVCYGRCVRSAKTDDHTVIR